MTDQLAPSPTGSEEGGGSRRRRARRGEGELLREDILLAAERLLMDTGDQEAVSIRAVADAVGVTPPSIYLHFADKQDLLFAVCERHFERFDRAVEGAAAGASDPLEALRRRGRAYIRFGLDNPEHYRILFMTKPERQPAMWTPERMASAFAFWNHVAAVQACLDAGLIRPGDAMEIALHLWAAVHGITALFIANPDFPWPDRDRLIEQYLELLVRGLAPAS
jgi:AcrR family transcriptional regulator